MSHRIFTAIRSSIVANGLWLVYRQGTTENAFNGDWKSPVGRTLAASMEEHRNEPLLSASRTTTKCFHRRPR